jgi:hypothetical protein
MSTSTKKKTGTRALTKARGKAAKVTAQRGRGRPKDSRQWRTWLRATIADRLAQLPGVSVIMGARIAIEVTQELSADKRHWRESSPAAEGLVRRVVYRLRKAPRLAVMPSPGLMLQAYSKLHDSIHMAGLAKAALKSIDEARKAEQALAAAWFKTK